MIDFNKIKGSYISLDELIKAMKNEDYIEIYENICDFLDNGKIISVKASPLNGKKPALHTKYKVIRTEKDNSELLYEINYSLCIEFDTSYYKTHLDKYEDNRKEIKLLNDFFIRKKHLLSDTISMNERAFQIWGQEKFLQKGSGKTILKNLGLKEEDLNYYDTSEPLAYYSVSKEVPQKILIIENKDTYYTFRKHLINKNSTLLNEDIKTVIYGKGKNINKTFKDFEISAEEHVFNKENLVLYLGDIDCEGIVIYESFYKYFSARYKVAPFVEGYLKMIDKAEELEVPLPVTKVGQNRNISNIFFENFTCNDKDRILKILERDEYIPQEILNIRDL
ncbi:hypothetical protein SAMN02745196_01205 [Clostridium collagenovorans DSM 3089]|uniref:Wadjet protein JetD C-terminal domain-containing protein n=1 Tax=Clostridium collagenovorans DSM 3089 TaxID=1121306 RepID=A0A1M5VB07_9CLOT|nr:Wadjet anti-phage system protein JetD domain-containing protein [Clostridium collagenovorans]SHH72420.1 hypothetical protein SAMN02745196_01205 [Clostridium collagenovorans DSM 3089]